MNDLRKDFLQSALQKHFGHKKFRSAQQFEAIVSVYAGKHDGNFCTSGNTLSSSSALIIVSFSVRLHAHGQREIVGVSVARGHVCTQGDDRRVSVAGPH